VNTLTLREREVFHRLAEGASNQEIADGMYITERTVRAHLCEIMRKLHLRSRLRACVASYFHAHRSSCPDPVANDN
jgi:DNA-binding NarL/FixJ family response regulator